MKLDWEQLINQGLWKNNPALVQLLGLCPLMAVSNSTVNALGLGLATIFVISLSNLCVSLIRNQVTAEVRLPVFVMIIASITTCIELAMQAMTFQLYQILGIFIPLIVTNCAVLGRAEGFAAKNPPVPALIEGFMMGSGFAIVLVVLGMLRELLGQGTLFANMDLLLGPMGANWTLTFFPNQAFLFAILPPGAFVLTGLLIALKNLIDQMPRKEAYEQKAVPGSKRVRVTD